MTSVTNDYLTNGTLVRWHNDFITKDLPIKSYLGTVLNVRATEGGLPEYKILWAVDGRIDWTNSISEYEIVA